MHDPLNTFATSSFNNARFSTPTNMGDWSVDLEKTKEFMSPRPNLTTNDMIARATVQAN